MDAKQHYVEDVWAGVAIGIVNNLIFTKRYQDKKVVVARISPSFLSHVERGTKKASLMTIKRIANALEVPIPNLFYPPKEPVVYLKSDQDLFTRLKSPLWAGQKVVVFKV